MLPAVVNSDYTVTVQSLCLVGDWWNRSFAVYLVTPLIESKVFELNTD